MPYSKGRLPWTLNVGWSLAFSSGLAIGCETELFSFHCRVCTCNKHILIWNMDFFCEIYVDFLPSLQLSFRSFAGGPEPSNFPSFLLSLELDYSFACFCYCVILPSGSFNFIFIPILFRHKWCMSWRVKQIFFPVFGLILFHLGMALAVEWVLNIK